MKIITRLDAAVFANIDVRPSRCPPENRSVRPSKERPVEICKDDMAAAAAPFVTSNIQAARNTRESNRFPRHRSEADRLSRKGTDLAAEGKRRRRLPCVGQERHGD